MSRKQELLDILQEECAEVVQAVSKVRRFGESERNIHDLRTEIGDVLGVLKLLMDEVSFLNPAVIEFAANAKIKKLDDFIVHKREQK